MAKHWYLCKAGVTLRNQINALYPNRDKSSDGSVGDLSHANRKSDHNPNSAGAVRAVDIDEDLGYTGARGFSQAARRIVDALCASKDARITYIIYEGRITVKGTNLQQWKTYTGSNAHKHHFHVSFSSDARLYDDPREFNLTGAPVATIPSNVTPDEFYLVRSGDTLWGISRKFTTSVGYIKQINGLSSDMIRVGQKLRIKG